MDYNFFLENIAELSSCLMVVKSRVAACICSYKTIRTKIDTFCYQWNTKEAHKKCIVRTAVCQKVPFRLKQR